MQNNRLLHLIKALWSLHSLTLECSLMEPQTSRQCTAAMAQKHNSMWVKWLKKHLCNFRCLEQKTSTRRKDKKQHQGIVISQLAGTAAVKIQKATVEVSLTRLEQEAEFGGSGLFGTSRRLWRKTRPNGRCSSKKIGNEGSTIFRERLVRIWFGYFFTGNFVTLFQKWQKQLWIFHNKQ